MCPSNSKDIRMQEAWKTFYLKLSHMKNQNFINKFKEKS